MSKVTDFVNLQDGHGGRVLVDYQSNVAVITIDRGENRINDEFTDQFNAALDEALNKPNLRAVITTGKSKFYCNGLDLKWLAEIDKNVPEYLPTFLSKWHKLQRRLLTLPVPTVAAINGHVYAGGAVLSLVHDYRIMQTGRGYWCLNEVYLGLHLSPWIIRLCRLKLSGQGAKHFMDAVVYGKRFTGEEAKKCGIVNDFCHASELIATAVTFIDGFVPVDGFGRDFVHTTKTNAFEHVLNARTDVSRFKMPPSNL